MPDSGITGMILMPHCDCSPSFMYRLVLKGVNPFLSIMISFEAN